MRLISSINKIIEILGGSRFPDLQKLFQGLYLKFSFVKNYTSVFVVGRAVTIIIFPSSGSIHGVVLHGALKCKNMSAFLSPIGC